MRENKLRIAVIFLGPYPKGNVSTIRIHSYCKAFAKKGYFVKVYLLSPCKEARVNKHKKGIFEGVCYEYMTDITWKWKKNSLLIKIMYYVVGLLRSLKRIKQDQINCLFSYHSNLVSNFYYWMVTRILSIPFIVDKTEYPYGYHQMSNFGKKVERFSLKFYDGFIVITEELKKFYFEINGNVFLLPMTVDAERFKGVIKKNVEREYIAVVFGTHNRDGVRDSIVAYKKYIELLNKKESYRLKLIGNFERLANKEEIKKYIEENELQDKVDIVGLLDVDKIPDVLKSSSCLLTTPICYDSGGFPTKLGEYMLSNVPIVSTSAGEISKYLEHKKEILLSEPGNIDGVAKNLLFIQENLEEANKMARNSYHLVTTVFNADNYVDDLIEFVEKLI